MASCQPVHSTAVARPNPKGIEAAGSNALLNVMFTKKVCLTIHLVGRKTPKRWHRWKARVDGRWSRWWPMIWRRSSTCGQPGLHLLVMMMMMMMMILVSTCWCTDPPPRRDVSVVPRPLLSLPLLLPLARLRLLRPRLSAEAAPELESPELVSPV